MSEEEWWSLHSYRDIEDVLEGIRRKPFAVLHTDGERVTVIGRRHSRMAAEVIAMHDNAMWVEWDPEHLWSSGMSA